MLVCIGILMSNTNTEYITLVHYDADFTHYGDFNGSGQILFDQM